MNKYRIGMSITAVTFALLLLPAITNNTPLFVNAQSQSTDQITTANNITTTTKYYHTTTRGLIYIQ